MARSGERWFQNVTVFCTKREEYDDKVELRNK